MLFNNERIVITGIGLTSPLGNNVSELRKSLLEGKSGVKMKSSRYMDDVPAGICDFDVSKYQKRKEARRGTRAGSISIYCCHESLIDAGIDINTTDKSKIGVFIGITEHGNVETENEIYNLSQFDYDTKFWSHHHNPRTVANNPAGEVNINMGITGLHYTVGAACAAGNLGVINGLQQLILGEVDVALAGGISESIHTFGIFAAFASQTALARHEDPEKASRPFDVDRNGIVISEGGCVYTLERLKDAKARGAKIYGEITGYFSNTDSTDFVLPNSERQTQCIEACLKRAGLKPEDVDIVNTHATGTPSGDVEEMKAVRNIFGKSEKTYINNTKSFIGHAMGAAGAIELAGNIPSFEDGFIHHTINVDNMDERCYMKNLVTGKPFKHGNVKTILNNSFGMLGINSVLVIQKFEE